MHTASSVRSRHVFINCPFDDDFRPFFHAMVFTLRDCGFEARCSLERGDGGEVRMHKIYRIIEEYELGIHDLSRRGLDEGSGLPRFNMPLELGVWLGARRYGSVEQRTKSCLILADEPYLYQAYLSDIAGQDIQAHKNEVVGVIWAVRTWVAQFAEREILPGPIAISKRFAAFNDFLDEMLPLAELDATEVTFTDFRVFLARYLAANPR